MTTEKPSAQAPIGSELVQENASFTDIVVQFVEGLGNRITTMEEALRAADFETLRIAAHQLKGSGGGYGYPVLTQHASELEKLANAGAVEECREQIDELRQLCSRVVVDVD